MTVVGGLIEVGRESVAEVGRGGRLRHASVKTNEVDEADHLTFSSRKYVCKAKVRRPVRPTIGEYRLVERGGGGPPAMLMRGPQQMGNSTSELHHLNSLSSLGICGGEEKSGLLSSRSRTCARRLIDCTSKIAYLFHRVHPYHRQLSFHQTLTSPSPHHPPWRTPITHPSTTNHPSPPPTPPPHRPFPRKSPNASKTPASYT